MSYGYADYCRCLWCRMARLLVRKQPLSTYDGPEGYDVDVLP